MELCQVWCRPQNLLGIFDYRSETVIRCDINKYAKLLFVHGSYLSSVQHMFGDKHFCTKTSMKLISYQISMSYNELYLFDRENFKKGKREKEF